MSETERMLGRDGSVAWLDDHQIAQRIRDLRTEATTWLGNAERTVQSFGCTRTDVFQRD